MTAVAKKLIFFAISEATHGVLCSVLASLVQNRQCPTEGYRDDEGTRASPTRKG